MKNILKLLYVVILFTVATDSFCQIAKIPKSFRFKGLNDSIPYIPGIPYQTLEPLNNEALNSYADSIKNICPDCGGDFYGSGIQSNFNIKLAAQYTKDNIDNGKLWIFKLHSATAYGFQFYFNKFIIPDSASLFIYNEDRTRMLGPYTKSNTPPDTNILIQFGTPQIYGSTVYFEYFESSNVPTKGHLVIENTIHIFRPSGGMHPTLGTSLPCEKDISCAAGLGWEKEANAVAAIWYYSPSFNLEGLCSGSLLNNTNQDGTPYFLTAGHCYNTFDPGNSKYDYATWQFAFRYHSKVCGQLDLSDFYVVYGSSVLAQDGQYLSSPYQLLTATTSDYLLLLLNSSKEELNNAGACYSGWTLNNPVVYPSSSYDIIHHPRGDVKKITTGTSVVNSTNLNFQYYFNWTTSTGAIEPGSSGAPLYNAYHQIIGTVKGVGYNNINPDLCAPEQVKVNLGKFSWHWSQGNFKQWLDPLNQTSSASFGVMTLCSNPNGTSVGLDGPIAPVNAPTYQSLKGGLKVNGKIGSSVITCPNGNISISPKTASSFYLDDPSWEGVDCDQWTCDDGVFFGQCRCKQWMFWSWKCECKFSYYQVYLAELDYNLNPTGLSGTKVYRVQSTSVGSINFNPSDVGMTLVAGKYYNIGVGHMANSGWQYSSTNFYMMPTSVNINNQSVSASIYADNSIYLQDVTVHSNQQLKVGTTNLINIKYNSSLQTGRYYTNSSLNCSNAAFRTFNTGNPESTSSAVIENNTLTDQVAIRTNGNADEIREFRLYPNPANVNLFLEISDLTVLDQKLTVSIHNSLGTEVYSSEVNNTTNLLDIDIKTLNKGLYILRLNIPKRNSQVFKFLKE